MRLRRILAALSVAPFTGAWIETRSWRGEQGAGPVAPFTGAWIETAAAGALAAEMFVAPFTGAWIETARRDQTTHGNARRTLHGCVD